jgi:hypothetical protein
LTVQWLYLYLHFPEFAIIIGTIFAVYILFKNTVLFLELLKENIQNGSIAHQLYFLNKPLILLELYLNLKMLLLKFTTVNSLNSVNVTGHCTYHCMLPFTDYLFLLHKKNRLLLLIPS